MDYTQLKWDEWRVLQQPKPRTGRIPVLPIQTVPRLLASSRSLLFLRNSSCLRVSSSQIVSIYVGIFQLVAMVHLILTGATGRVGSAALAAMLRNPSVTRVSVLSRSPVPQATDTEEAKRKCNVIIHADFGQPPSDETLGKLRGAKGCVWAQGISITEVPRDKYENITFDWPLMWAKRLTQAEPIGEDGKINFVYVSGEGATTKPGFATPAFGRIKGQAEASLLELSKNDEHKKLRVYSARPGGVDNSAQPEIQQYTSGKSTGLHKYVIEGMLMPILRKTMTSQMSPTRELGDSLVQLAAGDGARMPEGTGISGEGRTLGNSALR